ncbi:hypothetical protein BDV24DRAFT_167357 [Aspergillus arachidicola]|uniref:Uncharacterized protein n=1 Tax=Aspergillus arachidicola TaxID=656916 RepID=A0A2G7FWG9_9EURO|nr:hypothetical protein BDV24DRAFT_167357 [Aspergillus arachidicola]PIG84922.1 hypothetical protein AARAC_005606 [Aspergillus arachidicola]
MAIPTAGVIVIVIVACLAVTSLGAAMWKQVYPTDHSARRYNYSRDQELYMRSVRLKNVGGLRQESRTKEPTPRDLESAVYTEDGSSRF